MVVRPIENRSETAAISLLIKQGEYRQALSRVVDLLGPDLGEYCFAMLDNQALAERAVIAALADMYAAMPTLNSAPLRPWLFEQARRTCIALQSEPKPTPPQAKGKAAEAQALRKAVTELSPEERDAVLLRYLARLDYGDVAAICDMDQETACKKAGKGLLRLRQITTGASADTRSTAPNPPSKPTGTRG